MNTTRFIQNFKQAQETLKPVIHPQSELNQLCLDIAIKLEELELRDREMSLTETKARQELELALITLKNQNAQLQAEALKSLIQAESMLRSVVDNAAINRANAYVGFLNVVGNASDTSAIRTHAQGVINTINQININPLTGLDDPLNECKNDLKALTQNGQGARDVYIYTPKFEIQKGERIKLFGFSSYGNNECAFVLEQEDGSEAVLATKTALFSRSKLGKYQASFKAKNDSGAWIADSIYIEVIEP